VRHPIREQPRNQAGDGARHEHQKDQRAGCGSRLQLRS
jgi:hypothetical protein